MLIFPFALFILLAGSLPWVAVARPPNKASWLLSMYLVCSANVVLTLIIVNSFQFLNHQWFILLIHMLLGGIGWLVWTRFGKYSLWGPFHSRKPRLEVQWLKHEPILTLLILFISLSYAFALAQIVQIPQNNMDSLSTHLSRIGFWRQNGSFLPWPTTMLDQVWYPVNAQLQTYWTLVFLGSDKLVGSVQWLASLVSALGVYGMARFYGSNQRQSSFASLIFLSFPLVALQSTTTQTDLVTMAFFMPAVYFLILGLRDGQNPLLILSAVSVGLGVGVKKSYFLLIPILGVIVLLSLLQFGRRILKPLMFWSLSVAGAMLLLGSYIYVINWTYFGDPFGSPTYLDSLIDVPQYEDGITGMIPKRARFVSNNPSHLSGRMADPASEGGILMELTYNTPRLLYQALDTSGLPRPLDGYAHKVKMRLARAFFRSIGFEEIEGSVYAAPGHVFSFTDKNINEESHAWYGPLSVLLLLPALVIGAWQAVRKRSYLALAPGLALLVFLPMEIILRPGWDPFQGRYFAPLVAMGASLMAKLFREKGNPVHEWLVSGLAVVILVVTLLYNPAKPTLGKFADEFHVWDNDRVFVQTIQRKNDRGMYYLVERIVPAGTVLGYYVPFFILDYPLFGEKLDRRLVPMVSPLQLSDVQWLRDQGIDYLLLPGGEGYPIPPPEYEVEGRSGGWILYGYMPSP